MSKPVIHQIVAGCRKGDAISDEAMLLSAIFAENGYESRIHCARETTSQDARASVGDLDELPAVVKPGDLALLHLSIGSRANLVFPTLNCRRAILYHNVTPSRFFERLNPPMAAALDEGRRQVASLAGVAEINLADSEYNAGELRELGYRDVRVLPLVIDAQFGSGEIDPTMRARLADDGCFNILFVGRVVPNKRHDKLLQVFHHFQHTVEPRSRLVIAGSSSGQEAYKSLLLGSVHTLEIQRVLMTEFISAPELNACYATASAFVCMSEHEGFCAPLLEAMAWDVPVFADAQAAVPETLAGAGVLFHGADSAMIAETIGKVVRDPALRDAVLDRQRRRLDAYRRRDVWAELQALLLSL
ncbi:MAG: glycosyltransferase [Kiritimatiellia bacterium]|jgi:glycosyltransferase involved in cell wall biosynthesis